MKNKLLFMLAAIVATICVTSSSVAAEDNYSVGDTDQHSIITVDEEILENKNSEAERAYIELHRIRDKIGNKEFFLRFRRLENEYSGYVDPMENIYDYFTEEEIDYIYRMVETETHGADFDSKANVASVFFNRYDSERFSDNAITIITSPGQFAYGKTNISEETMMAVEYAFQFGDTTQGALFFHSGAKTSSFNGASYIFTDDAGHHFYK